MKILILCTANSCRSQIAAGFLKSFAPKAEVFSAGTHPGTEVDPIAIRVMREDMIDLLDQQPRNVSDFLSISFDLVITVCDNAKEQCPVFLGEVKQQLHIGFEDPAGYRGSEEERVEAYRTIRDEIKQQMFILFKQLIH